MAFQPAAHLTNRTFVGLIIAQFLAGFSDQAIHASAMFYAINTGFLTQAQAITLMPILFYAPWALFCAHAGYFADRYSKTGSLIAWKIAEIVISIVLALGFYLGSEHHMTIVGGVLVMSCVFLMGTHAAFFAPAKYGAMPEILQAHILSRGNGVLESSTFLAAILGTVSGGLLSSRYAFQGHEEWIGVTLIVVSLIGAGASLLIGWLPAANPTRLFPYNPVTPIMNNLRALFQTRPLALSVLGIAFFVFMVSYMRAAVYMHGETRNPRWDELKTSITVAYVALGVGLGSPLAGYLSGGKVELGLVPLGCLGMMAATLVAGIAIEYNTALIAALIVIGFFSGFYMVPLYTLLQHRAPKASKGDLIATSNFINVTGAIAASLLFGSLIWMSQHTGLTPLVPVQDKIAVGKLVALKRDKRSKVIEVDIELKSGRLKIFHAKTAPLPQVMNPEDEDEYWSAIDELADIEVIDFDEDLLELMAPTFKEGDEVIVLTYDLHGVTHYRLRPADQVAKPVFDLEILPRLLFIGASLMTLGILILLWWKLPDFFTRTLFWLHSLGRFEIQALGTKHLPARGPVILATNAHTLDGALALVSATDRSTLVVLRENGHVRTGGLLRALARLSSLVEASDGHLAVARARAARALAQGHLLAVSVDADGNAGELEELLHGLRQESQAPIIPVYCGPLDPDRPRQVRVIFGDALDPAAKIAAVQKVIAGLAEQARNQGATTEA